MEIVADFVGASPFLAVGIGGSIGVLVAALALGIRHGIDWDHIAAITDITSTTAAARDAEEGWLIREPGLMLTDESHHSLAGGSHAHSVQEVSIPVREAVPVGVGAAAAASPPVSSAEFGSGYGPSGHGNGRFSRALAGFVISQRRALFLGSLYALGHGTVVTILGLLAILASEFLPGWIDPIMERVVGVTLIFLAAYLFYSLFRFFRGGGEFRIRSRWMMIFAGVRRGFRWLRAKVSHEHPHDHDLRGADQYGVRTAYGVGMIHGIGAETGTQVLVIATAVGAGTKLMGIGALLAFVFGLLISNSFITVASTAGFVSSQRRQAIYVFAGVLAAVFSLIVGLVFLFEAGSLLPNLDPYFRWIGGPDA